MLTLRRSEDRGPTNFGWLDSKHSFSFGDYFDPAHMGFGALRVINDDWVAAGAGFDTHPHQNMEIVTYVLEGALQHRDSLGTGAVIRPGEVQRMTAGTGILHSEFNPSPTEPVHLLQIWIKPESKGLTPSYEQKAFPIAEQRNRLHLIGSRDGRNGSVIIHQDVSLYAAALDPDESVTHTLTDGRRAWIQVARGTLQLNGKELKAGDGVAVESETRIVLAAIDAAEVLLFDLA